MEKVRIEYLSEYFTDREKDHKAGTDDSKKWLWEVHYIYTLESSNDYHGNLMINKS